MLSQIGFDRSLEHLAQQLMWHAIAMLGDLDMRVGTNLATLSLGVFVRAGRQRYCSAVQAVNCRQARSEPPNDRSR